MVHARTKSSVHDAKKLFVVIYLSGFVVSFSHDC